MKKEQLTEKNTKDYRDDYPRWKSEMKSTYKILIPDMLPWHFAIIERLLKLEGYDVEAHRAPPPFCFFSSRLTDSSTTAEMARLMSTHIMALRSSPVRQYWYTEVEMVAVRPGV